MLTFHVKLVSLKNIDIYSIYGPKSLIFVAYAQIWAYSIFLITRLILSDCDNKKIKTLYMYSGD